MRLLFEDFVIASLLVHNAGSTAEISLEIGFVADGVEVRVSHGLLSSQTLL